MLSFSVSDVNSHSPGCLIKQIKKNDSDNLSAVEGYLVGHNFCSVLLISNHIIFQYDSHKAFNNGMQMTERLNVTAIRGTLVLEASDKPTCSLRGWQRRSSCSPGSHFS